MRKCKSAKQLENKILLLIAKAHNGLTLLSTYDCNPYVQTVHNTLDTLLHAGYLTTKTACTGYDAWPVSTAVYQRAADE